MAKFGIQLHRAPVEGDGLEVLAAEVSLPAQVVGLERLQRRRGGLLDRGGELLDGGERLAQLLAEASPRPRRAGPGPSPGSPPRPARAAMRLAAGRVHRLQVDDVVAAEARDRPGQQRLDALPLGDLAREIPRHPLVGRPAHVAKRLPDAFLREDVQERALPELHRHGLPERPVEDVVAGRVDEVRDQDAVLVREGAVRGRPARVHEVYGHGRPRRRGAPRAMAARRGRGTGARRPPSPAVGRRDVAGLARRWP